jgi:predicted dehydrogenase
MMTHPADLKYLPDMPTRTDVRIGCIGSGFIMSDCHLVAYRQAGFTPVAIASRRPEQASVVAAQHDIETVYPSYLDLLLDERIEVVDIAVPPDVQLEVIREVVRHRHIKGVLAQKPLAANTADAETIVTLCRQRLLG